MCPISSVKFLGCTVPPMYNELYTMQHSTCRRREKITKCGTLYKCIRPKANMATDKGSGTLAAIFKSLLDFTSEVLEFMRISKMHTMIIAVDLHGSGSSLTLYLRFFNQ